MQLRLSKPAYAFVAFALVAATVPFARGLSGLYEAWISKPEYSYGVLVPVISLFLIWRQRTALLASEFTGSWNGLAVVGVGLVLWLAGELSTIYTVIQYGFILVLYGLVLALTGFQVFRRLWMPLLLLLFMVPLPALFSNNLSLQLQLISSALGVWLVRLFGISVFLQGNVIDLGSYQLQVAEACDGLRYLFPLMTLAFVVAYAFQAPFWKRALVFLSSIPIAIAMNSIRIGLIGVTVEYWGVRMAEGLLHEFEGWAVFMVSTALVVLVALALARLGRGSGSYRNVLALPPVAPPEPASQPGPARLPAPFLAGSVLAMCAAAATFALPERQDSPPPRRDFAEFPSQVDDWHGEREELQDVYLETLQLDDYLFADYRRTNHIPVNLYVAYYRSQRQGRSVHSPRSCIPGGGWSVRSLEQWVLPTGRGPLPVNRAVVELGGQRELVYYWFQQRGRQLTSEYLVKWFIFWDSMLRNRSDGAMVRIIAPIPQGMREADIDAEAARFAAAVVPRLDSYVPN